MMPIIAEGGHGQVHEPAYVALELLLGLADRLGQVGPVVGVRDHEPDSGQDVVGDTVVEFVQAVLEGLAHLGTEVLIGAGAVASGADDGVLLRESAGSRQAVETGEQLALGQVAGGTEEYEDVRAEVCVVVAHHGSAYE